MLHYWTIFAELIGSPFEHLWLVWGVVPLYFALLLNELTATKANFRTAIQTGFSFLWAGAQWLFAYYPSHVLFASLISAALHPTQYAADIPFAWAIQLGDVVALVGATLAVVLGLVYSRFWRPEATTMAAFLFAALAALVQPGDLWVHLGRIISPLLLILTSAWIRSGRVLLMAPTLLILPRVLMQFGKQVYGILHFSWL